MEGFFVPGSQSSSYVSSKRNEEGSYAYDSAAIDIGQQKQAALQDLSKTYESTIENAYASYLANQRNIATSAMGQGYQEAYNQLAQQNLINNITSTTQSLNQARLELEEQESAAREDLNTMFATETANLDKVVTSMDNYLTYVKGLSNSSGQGYLNDEQQNQTVDELYDVLFGAQPQGFTDEEGNSGLTYSQWVHSQLNDSDMDQNWYNWLFYQGGWQDFQNALAKERNQTAANQYQADLVAAEEARKAEEERQAQAAREEAIRNENINNQDYQGLIGTSTDGFDEAGYVTMDSDTSKNISNALHTEEKLKTGEWQIGDIIKYNGYYYRIDQVRPDAASLSSTGNVAYTRLTRHVEQTNSSGTGEMVKINGEWNIKIGNNTYKGKKITNYGDTKSIFKELYSASSNLKEGDIFEYNGKRYIISDKFTGTTIFYEILE